MSFFNGIKRVFGFEPDYDDEELSEDYVSDGFRAAELPSAPHPVMPPALPVSQKDADKSVPSADSSLPADLFDAVLEVFNSAQPDFVRRCLSTDAQRQYLIDSLSQSLRERVARTVGDETDIELRNECETLRRKAEEGERLRKENKKLQLSIENQKRALQDRITDLEHQLEKAQAAKRGPRAKAAPGDAISGLIASGLAAELHRQTLLREQAEMKSRMADRMMSDLRNAAAVARRELEENQTQQEEVVAMVNDKLGEFEQLKKRLEDRIRELQDALRKERAADHETRIAALNKENAELRHTIENNLANQAGSEKRLRDEIKALREQIETLRSNDGGTESPAIPHTNSDTRDHSRRRGRPKKVRIDEELSSTDWFTQAESPETPPPAQKKAPKDDPDFGYHEPARRPSNDDAAQLTLF
ncbi:MAG: hypothetical protein J1E29_04055 [Duncaniella sp.]|nr:hypothetical protein [Duncaniella sp.]